MIWLLAAALACASPVRASSEDPVSLAIAARDQGDAARAAALWEKAVELDPTDGFLITQKAWSYLALGRMKDAKKAFAKAAEFSSDTAGQSEAQFGLGVTQVLDSDYKAAAKTLEGVCRQSPYLYPLASAWLARVAEHLRKPDIASLYFRHSLEQDPLHPSALDALGDLYESHKMDEDARQCFRQALAINDTDGRAREGLKKAEQEMGDAAAAPSRRIAAPLLQKPVAPPASPNLRVRLFTDPAGAPAALRKIRFASGVDWRIVKDGKPVADASANQIWEAVWDPESRVLEIRDAGRKLRYAGRDVVRIEPAQSGASVLLRDAELASAADIDTGDRELRGAVELRPLSSGFYLVNELGVEEYLYSQLGALSPAGAPVEALKAEAIVLRSSLAAAKKRFASAGDSSDLCDSPRCQLYIGLGQERSEATAAVDATAGQSLKLDAKTPALLHAHCAGITEEGIIDSSMTATLVSTSTNSVTSPAAQASKIGRAHV